MVNQNDWRLVGDQIDTRWTEDVDPNRSLPEYPRPQFRRDDWLNLNGLWNYLITSEEVEMVNEFGGKILVPYPIESALSGVCRKLKPNQKLWYNREFTIPKTWMEKRVLLHFGAIDWETKIWINGEYVGSHKGGYVPFEFDISTNLKDGKNEITLSVWDPTDEGKQEHGKQSLDPKAIFYTAISGIWQTIWLEPVPKSYIKGFKLASDIDDEIISIKSIVINPDPKDLIEILIFEADKLIINQADNVNQKQVIKINSPKLWSPNNPFLYSMVLKIKRGVEVIDQVDSYFGMRKIALSKDENGIIKIELNNKPLFQYGILDQGYWPDGLYTAPTDVALRYDIEITKELGFNMIRKHVKIEPARWYYHCDKLGLLVWQDMPNGGMIDRNNLLGNIYEYETQREEIDKKNYYSELESMINHLYNSPSIITWVPFNEGWGQFKTDEVTDFIRQLDRTRLIDSASGWYDYGVGDIYDIHRYPNPILPSLDKAKSRALVVGEFGGLGLEIKNHVWKRSEKFVYRMFSDSDKLMKRYERLIKRLISLKKKGLSAAIYTQITDVEGELNGLLTYDRKIIKINKEHLQKLHHMVFD